MFSATLLGLNNLAFTRKRRLSKTNIKPSLFAKQASKQDSRGEVIARDGNKGYFIFMIFFITNLIVLHQSNH